MRNRQTRHTQRPWMAGVALLSSAVIGLLAMLFEVTRRHGHALLRIDELESRPGNAETVADAAEENPQTSLYQHGVPPGSVAMNFELPDIHGGNRTLTEYKGGQVLLIFFSPECPASRSMLPALAAAGNTRVPIVLISTGTLADNRDLMREHGIHSPVLVQESYEVALMYYISATPMGYLLDSDGLTQIPRLDGPLAILGIVSALGANTGSLPENSLTPMDFSADVPTRPLRRADDLPTIHVPLLDGGELATEQYSDRRWLLMMFDPLSAPSVDLLPDLASMHRNPGQPDVVMITRRDPELTRELARIHDMPYPIGVQEHWDVSRKLGTLAVPSACVVSPGGYLESDIAAGQQAIFGLLKPLRAERSERRLVALTSLLRQ